MTPPMAPRVKSISNLGKVFMLYISNPRGGGFGGDLPGGPAHQIDDTHTVLSLIAREEEKHRHRDHREESRARRGGTAGGSKRL